MGASPVAVKITDDVKARVKKLAEAKSRSQHWLMREAIEQYVDREERREKVRQDGLKAWNDFQETGLHLTFDEVADWLKSWGTDEEKAEPECHR